QRPWHQSRPARSTGPPAAPADGAAEHVLAVGRLPPLHRDPFDRLLLAQAEREGLLLITADPVVARYPGPVRHRDSF
ncbi:MAG: hypothetical protein VKM17_12070, partial [Cyanobacteriota bacterium]|nr:hypothetical protein [Cyanobacteriota bacterium]